MFKKSRQLYPAIKVERKAPVNITGGEPDFPKSLVIEFKAVQLYEYSNVNFTPEGIVFKNFNLDKDLLIYPAHTKTYNLLYLFSTVIKRKKVALTHTNKYLLCIDYWSNSIFHWMCDVMPRLEAIKQQTNQYILILPEFFRYPYIHDTLKAFRFKDILYLKDSEFASCSELCVPGHITVSGQMRPDNILALRKTLIDHFKPNFTGKFNIPDIYISRNKAKYRKVINESELIPILKKSGFQIIYFEDLSTSEQVELSYNARNIVSIHGANLTNIIFMQANNSVLELRKKNDRENNYFYELADSVNCNYFYLNCEFEDPVPGKNFFSLYVDIQSFDKALHRLKNGI
jgi:hypothetical protein